MNRVVKDFRLEATGDQLTLRAWNVGDEDGRAEVVAEDAAYRRGHWGFEVGGQACFSSICITPGAIGNLPIPPAAVARREIVPPERDPATV